MNQDERHLRDQVQATLDGVAGPAVLDRRRETALVQNFFQLANELERLATTARRVAEAIAKET